MKALVRVVEAALTQKEAKKRLRDLSNNVKKCTHTKRGCMMCTLKPRKNGTKRILTFAKRPLLDAGYVAITFRPKSLSGKFDIFHKLTLNRVAVFSKTGVWTKAGMVCEHLCNNRTCCTF